MPRHVIIIPSGEQPSIETTRRPQYRQRRLGKKEYARRELIAHQRTGGTRRAKHFAATRLDAILAMCKPTIWI